MGSARKLLLASASLPAMAILLAAWGSTWGWNFDGKLGEETPAYLVASLSLFLGPGFAVYKLGSVVGGAHRRISARAGLLEASWGVYVSIAAALLTHIFDSEALWFGSIGLSYLGFFVAVVAVIRVLAG